MCLLGRWTANKYFINLKIYLFQHYNSIYIARHYEKWYINTMLQTNLSIPSNLIMFLRDGCHLSVGVDVSSSTDML